MIIRKYEDGSEFTGKHLAAALVAGAAIAVPLIYANEKYNDWKTRRIMKKYGWPKDSWKKK